MLKQPSSVTFPPSSAASKQVPLIVNSLTDSFTFTVWIALPKNSISQSKPKIRKLTLRLYVDLAIMRWINESFLALS